MGGGIHGCANLFDPGSGPRRSFVVNHADGFDIATNIGAEMLLHLIGIGPAAPISLNDDRHQSEISRRSCPQQVELARPGKQDAIARRERIHECRFQGSRARRRKQDDRTFRPEDGSNSRQHPMGKFLELRTAVVDHLPAHGGEDAFRNRSGARHLEKVTTRLLNRVLHRIVLFESHVGLPKRLIVSRIAGGRLQAPLGRVPCRRFLTTPWTGLARDRSAPPQLE